MTTAFDYTSRLAIVFNLTSAISRRNSCLLKNPDRCHRGYTCYWHSDIYRAVVSFVFVLKRTRHSTPLCVPCTLANIIRSARGDQWQGAEVINVLLFYLTNVTLVTTEIDIREWISRKRPIDSRSSKKLSIPPETARNNFISNSASFKVARERNH